MDENKEKKKVTLLCHGLIEEEHNKLENLFSETIDIYLDKKGIKLDFTGN